MAKESIDYSYSEENLENEPSPVGDLLKGIFNPEMLKEDENTHPYAMEFDENDLENVENPTIIEPENKLDSYSGSDHTTSVFATENNELATVKNADEAVEYQLENQDASEDHEEFNLRQAIIHQVILERPY